VVLDRSSILDFVAGEILYDHVAIGMRPLGRLVHAGQWVPIALLWRDSTFIRKRDDTRLRRSHVERV
jgi:hypothetical protein